MKKKLSRFFTDLVFIISYLVMGTGLAVAIIGDQYYHSIKTLVIGLAILVLGAIIFGVIYRIDDEPRCFGAFDV